MSTNLEVLATAVLRSGIIPQPSLAEFKRWGFDFTADEQIPLTTADAVVNALEVALQSEGLVVERVTDLDILNQYARTAMVGTLHVEIEEQSAQFPVPYGVTLQKEYIIPWKGDNIFEEMVNGRTHLVLESGQEVYFSHVRELFFSSQKTFMVCSPAKAPS